MLRIVLPVAALLTAGAAVAEEGMWTFDNFPLARANRDLGTRIDQAWLDRVRLASVKIGGASGGLVSAEGLILTNEHVVSACVEDLSTAQRNFVQTGFTPASRAEEQACPGMTVEVLTGIADVTGRVQAAGAGLSGQAFTQARDAEVGRIESEACGADRSRRCQVVSLYRGGRFSLYTYRRYGDVRLAFAPEHRAAAFGGDLDNFSFPRFAIDSAFLRIYENGAPVRTPNHFRWNAAPPIENQPVFLSGSPGATQRLLTQAQLETVEEVVLPLQQLTASELRGRLLQFMATNEQNAFVAGQALSGVENGYKRQIGRMRALIDDGFMAGRQTAEDDFRRRWSGERRTAPVDNPWTALEGVQPDMRRLYPAYYLLEGLVEGRGAGMSQLLTWANQIVRAAQEKEKPNAQRLVEYGDARLAAIETRVLAPRPTYAALEEVEMAWWLSKLREVLTVDDPRIRPLLGNESPEALAHRLATTTRLGDPDVRRALWEGGIAAVQASDDPLIRWMIAAQPAIRSTRAEYEEKVQGPTDRAAEALAEARFALYGTSLYPDATGTLRLTYGRVQGWTYEGVTVPYATNFAGLWERATGAEPFNLAPRLAAARGQIPPATILDVAASTDTIGGSSGSPAVNEAGEVIGINFDSTVLTQRNAYGYDPAVNRSVLVTTAAITAALRHAYGMERLLTELGVRQERPRR